MKGKNKEEEKKRENEEAKRKAEEVDKEAQEEKFGKEGTSSSITETKFERVVKKAQEKTEKKLLRKVDKVAFFKEKSKGKKKEKTFDNYCEEFGKDIEELSPLKDEA
ncbi:protein MNN4-like [Cucumis melo var. makuwa]|uniref:Protein MNN4-like n=1 Tax=Cucumis melo var. makuwa TaxID=1194695 RepID=A0A5D3C0B4_CUCMM|nr:protein MNN4-like [Cucumis melo var. makuwa]